MGYNKYALIPNLGVIYYIFVILAGLTLIAYMIDRLVIKSTAAGEGRLPLTKFGANFLLRFFMAVYLEVCISTMIQFQGMQWTGGLQFFISCASAVVFAVLSLGVIAWVLSLMWQAPSEAEAVEAVKGETDAVEIDMNETEQRIRGYKTLYLGLNIRHERRSLYHPLMFFVRRLIFAALIVFLNPYPNI